MGPGRGSCYFQSLGVLEGRITASQSCERAGATRLKGWLDPQRVGALTGASLGTVPGRVSHRRQLGRPKVAWASFCEKPAGNRYARSARGGGARAGRGGAWASSPRTAGVGRLLAGHGPRACRRRRRVGASGHGGLGAHTLRGQGLPSAVLTRPLDRSTGERAAAFIGTTGPP